MFDYGNNLLDKNDLDAVWKEIDLVFDQMMDPKTAGAADNEGVLLKSGKGFFITDSMAKFVAPRISKIAQDFMPQVDTANKFTLLINYYGDGDYYHEHSDDSLKTLNVMLCKGEQQFTGGEFVFPEDNVTLPFESNSYVLFEGKKKHKVNTVRLNNKEGKSGRFTLTYFFYRE
jgi:Rps23 Pro-64 3,4-dihydroxylase Tpa1-like proline 4-hydroxylase